jgi:hypothetical protein
MAQFQTEPLPTNRQCLNLSFSFSCGKARWKFTKQKILKLEQRIFKLEQQIVRLKDKHQAEIAKLKAENQELREHPIMCTEEQRMNLIAMRKKLLAQQNPN